MAYLLDASVFIEAKRRHYGLDFCPAFWDWLIDGSEKKLLLSIEKVLDELIEGGDELVEWSARLGKEFFAAPDQDTILSLAAAMEWVRRQQFKQAAVSAFAGDADAYLIAHAHAHGHVLVTHEQPSDGIRQVKIPNVCIALGVKYVNTFEMLRRERARFILGP